MDKKFNKMNPVKLVCWLISSAVIIMLVYLYLKHSRERINKSWRISSELATVNQELKKINGVLKRDIVALEIVLMKKNAQLKKQESLIEELRNKVTSS